MMLPITAELSYEVFMLDVQIVFLNADVEETVVVKMARHDGQNKIGFRSLKSDPCIYVSKDGTGSVILTLHVDGILLLGANKQLLNKLKNNLWTVSRCRAWATCRGCSV